MTPELIFLIVSGLVVGVILLAGLSAVVSARRGDAGAFVPVGPGRPAAGRAAMAPKYQPDAALGAALYATPIPETRAAYRSVIRVFWWLASAGIPIGIGLAAAFPETRAQVFAIGGLGVLSVLVFHEILPIRQQAGFVLAAEALVATALAAALLMLTGYGSSPFAALLPLTVVATSLAGRRRAAAAGLVLASAAYLGVLLADPSYANYVAADLLAFSTTLASVWLLGVLAAFVADHERRARAAALERSVMDPLTDLFNRAQLFIDLDQEVQRTRRSDRPFSLLMVDLDGLKALNDTFGHARGDSVLRSLSAVIRRSVRTVDSAYRYGGDEFVVLLPETDFAGAFVVAEKIRVGAEDVGATFVGAEQLTSVSIGLVSHPEDGDGVEELMLAADRAMYAAKAAGRNQISGAPRAKREPPQATTDKPVASPNDSADPRIKAAIDALRSPPPSTSGGVA